MTRSVNARIRKTASQPRLGRGGGCSSIAITRNPATAIPRNPMHLSTSRPATLCTSSYRTKLRVIPSLPSFSTQNPTPCNPLHPTNLSSPSPAPPCLQTQLTVIGNAYDGFGHRITESPTNRNALQLYYSTQWQVIEERLNTSSSHAHTQYVWSAVSGVV